jgi:NADPH:quinone reductase-like Zn-dependent oxidoreductase
MKAIVVTNQAARTAGMTLVERPEPEPAIDDVVVRVRASGFTSGELTWPSTWTDRLDRDRTPSIPGQGLAGVVTALGYGTTGVFDVIGGDIQKRSAGVIRAGGTLVTIAGPPEARPDDGLAIDFVVLPDRAQLGEIVQRVRDGRLRTNIGNVATLDDAVAAFNPTERISGQTIIRVSP